ncbi:MAG: SBBP repeat-containing protein [Ignavibacterium album]|jgi:DNA-binding beta-propeller fold protein YncE|uniref:6-bladed beta-propeller n=1 Tax=Ignavibacterium album TaxID=591197 RepID=UPI0026F2DA02|nr:6-bladed beta-propeller [Ignavibacterium album]MBI5663132.1 SBBP repeat-containing protein [Ignavibacterium album]
MKSISKYLFLFLLPVCISQPFSNHSDNKKICKNPRIEWLDEISLKSINTSNGGFFESLSNFIFGQEDLTIMRPFNLLMDSNGTIFFIDQAIKKIIKYSFDENEIETLLSDKVEFKSPVGLCLTSTDLVITDSERDIVYKYNFDSEDISILTSYLQQPTGIIYLEHIQEFWVCETKQHRIVRLDKEGNIIGLIGQRGVELGQFNFPTFIWTDKNGRIYVNDSMNFRIQVFSEQGYPIKQFGKSGDGSGDLARPKGIATDSYGNIYVVDALFNNVQVFDQSGKLLSTFGVQGTDKGEFWLPIGIFINDENKIFISDSFNSRIQIFQLKCDD